MQPDGTPLEGKGPKKPLIENKNTPASELKWRNRYQISPSFLSIHLGVKKECIPANSHCHHLILNHWEAMEKEQGVVFISIPTLLDKSLAPKDHHIVHAFTPSSMSEWKKLSPSEYKKKKEVDYCRLISKIQQVFPDIKEHISHKEIGTPKSHRRFLGRHNGSYGPIPRMTLPGLLPMPFNSTAIKGLYCVGDSCFPGQGLNAVAFSGFACAHKIGAKLGLNAWALPN